MDINDYSEEELIKRDLYLKKLAEGVIQGPSVGVPSIDKPWLKYYKEEELNNSIPNMNVIEYIKYQNKDNLDNIAIDSIEGKYTYREMFQMNDMVTASLSKMGVKKGDNVLVMLPNISFEDFLFYGVAQTGASTTYLIPEATSKQICDTINDLNVNYFFIFDYFLTAEMEEEIYHKTNIKNIIEIGFNKTNRDARTMSWQEFINEGLNYDAPKYERKPEDLLFIAKTGGTTGEPKSVMLSDRSFIALTHQFLNTDLPYDKNDRWLRLWPIFSATAAVSSFFLAHAAGMEEVIRPFPKFEEFADLILAERPNHLMIIPMLLDALEKTHKFDGVDLSFIKSAGCGGMAMSSAFEERVNAFFKKYNLPIFLGFGWGQTENGSSAAMRMNEETTKIGYIGIPLPKTTVSVFDPDTLEELGYNEEGELCINSKSIMLGYYHEEELTKKVLREHKDGSTWLHTGDLGEINEDGFVKVIDRMTRSILTFPTAKIYPTALEDVISKIPGVLDNCVVGAPDPVNEGFKILICYIVPDENVNAEELINYVDNILTTHYPENARPRHYIAKDILPLTKVGKHDIRLLEQEYLDNHSLSRIKK